MNGNRSLSFLLPKSPVNTHAYDLVEEESIAEYDGHKYRIKSVEERFVGQTTVKIITASHTFFDLVDEYRYTTLTNGTKSISQALAFIFDGTNDWTFSVIDSFAAVELEDFGNANCLELFSKVLEHYGAEYELSGNDVIIREKIGNLIDLQFRYNHNIKTFKKSLDTSNLSTYIKGKGKRNKDGTYVVESEYTSPNASIFGIKHAPPYSNDSITQLSTLEKNMKRSIIDVPEVSIELEFVVLKDAGYTKEKPELGDTVPTIYEPLNDLNLDLRVMEIEEYPEENRAPKVTLATVRKSLAKASFSYQKALLDKIYDENSGRLRYNVYDEAVKQATEALNNSLTELEYPAGMGIIARDPNDANRFVALRSSGLGVTTDGGLTFKEAITANGVTTSLLTAGQIKTNNVQIIGNGDLFYWDGTALMAINSSDPNKYVKLNSSGLYVAKGAITIERPDGALFVQDGLVQSDFAVQAYEPVQSDPGISVSGRWWTTVESTEQTINAFAFKHSGRYLKVSVNHTKAQDHEGSGGWYLRGFGAGEGIINGAYSFSNFLEENGYETQTIDLGPPTYQELTFYLKLRSTQQGRAVYLRKLRFRVEG